MSALKPHQISDIREYRGDEAADKAKEDLDDYETERSITCLICLIPYGTWSSQVVKEQAGILACGHQVGDKCINTENPTQS